MNLLLIKGCTADGDHKPQITRYRLDPGLSIVSYTHVCRHWDFCNDLSSTRPLWLPPPVTGARGRWGHVSGTRGGRKKNRAVVLKRAQRAVVHLQAVPCWLKGSVPPWTSCSSQTPSLPSETPSVLFSSIRPAIYTSKLPSPLVS